MIEATRARIGGPVLVVGSGLLGTSIGLALRRSGVEVVLEDSREEVVAQAAARGAGVTGPPVVPPAVVVVCVPPGSAASVMREQALRWPDATITDVTSVKRGPLEALADLGEACRRIVGGHPMAGREVSGPGGARVDLFEDRLWVITPLPQTEPGRVDQVRAMVALCGGVVAEMSAQAHDRAVAMTSHVPQLMSSLVAARIVDADPGDVAVSGQGLRDLTRVAGSDPALWTDILTANAAPVAEVLRAMADDLAAVIDALSSGRPGPVDELLRRGNAGHAAVPGKHGQAAADYAVVPVMVADEPGELARLFAAAGEAGINLEDVRIDHVLGRPSGLVELSVRAESGVALDAALRERGFDVRS